MFCLLALLAKDLPGHLETSTNSHLQLMLGRQQEHQSVIATMYTKVHELEALTKSQAAHITALEAALAASTVALKASETRNEKQLQDQIKQLDNKFSRNLTSVSNEMQGELSRVKKAVTDLVRK